VGISELHNDTAEHDGLLLGAAGKDIWKYELLTPGTVESGLPFISIICIEIYVAIHKSAVADIDAACNADFNAFWLMSILNVSVNVY